jgi:hypothetical protein
MTRLGLVIEHAGLASTDDQRVTLASAGVDRVVALAPRTQEDWHYRIRDALDDLGDEDAVVVTALTSLGLGAAALLDGIAAVREQDVRLVSLAEGLDTDAAPDFLPGVALLTRAIEAGRLAEATAIIARARHRDAVTPPKAELVDRALWEAAQHDAAAEQR